jgi:hypothetical protein
MRFDIWAINGCSSTPLRRHLNVGFAADSSPSSNNAIRRVVGRSFVLKKPPDVRIVGYSGKHRSMGVNRHDVSTGQRTGQAFLLVQPR